MTIKRALSTSLYLTVCIFWSYLAVNRMAGGHLTVTSSFGIPYWFLYIIVFLIPIGLCIVQIALNNQKSSLLIILLTIFIIGYDSYDYYQFSTFRNTVAYPVKGKVPDLTFGLFIKRNWILLSVLTALVLLHPFKRRTAKNKSIGIPIQG